MIISCLLCLGWVNFLLQLTMHKQHCLKGVRRTFKEDSLLHTHMQHRTSSFVREAYIKFLYRTNMRVSSRAMKLIPFLERDVSTFLHNCLFVIVLRKSSRPFLSFKKCLLEKWGLHNVNKALNDTSIHLNLFIGFS